MYTTLISYVDFTSISLVSTLACALVAMALTMPALGMAWVISSIEEMYWVHLFSERVVAPHFVLPAEIAALPLELDSSKELFCTVGGLVIEPKGSVPAVRAKTRTVEAMLADIDWLLSAPIGSNSYLSNHDFA